MNNTTIPHWYLILDGLTLVFSIIGTVISMSFLLTVIVSRQERQSILNLIACNTQLPIFLLSGITVHSIAKVLLSDLYGMQIFDAFCIWRAYFVYTEIAHIFHSFVVQSYYGYVNVMYAVRPQYGSMRTLLIIMIVQWLIIHGAMLVLPLRNMIDFDIESQMCSVSLVRYWTIWLMSIFVYAPPWNIIAFVYLRLAIFSRQSRMRAGNATLNNARRELQLIQRMFLVLTIFSVCALPYTMFAIIALFNPSLLPVYHYRIITCFNATALAIASNIILWQSVSVRQILTNVIMLRKNRRIQPSLAPPNRIHG